MVKYAKIVVVSRIKVVVCLFGICTESLPANFHFPFMKNSVFWQIFRTKMATSPAEAEMEKKLMRLKKDELKVEARKLSLDESGTKSDLVISRNF